MCNPETTLIPRHDCGRCVRLRDFRHENRCEYPKKHNGPVPSFGSCDAKLLIVGLAPGLRGANFSGRPFTGDYAGDLLYATLNKFALSTGTYAANANDGLKLINTRITNAVRCVPPKNKPIASEIAACREFLLDEIRAMKKLKVILALGLLAHGAVLAALAIKKSSCKFAHGTRHSLPEHISLVDSYHCSRYNTNTGRLTKDMFDNVFDEISHML